MAGECLLQAFLAMSAWMITLILFKSRILWLIETLWLYNKFLKQVTMR